jgi:hypothetical protein
MLFQHAKPPNAFEDGKTSKCLFNMQKLHLIKNIPPQMSEVYIPPQMAITNDKK